jgi:hypothetical protein
LPRRKKARKTIRRRSSQAPPRPRFAKLLRGVQVQTLRAKEEERRRREKVRARKRPSALHKLPKAKRRRVPKRPRVYFADTKGVGRHRRVRALRLEIRVQGDTEYQATRGRGGVITKHIRFVDSRGRWSPKSFTRVQEQMPELTERLQRLYKGKFDVLSVTARPLRKKQAQALRLKPV